MSATIMKLREEKEGHSVERQSLKCQVQEALQEKLTFKLRLQENQEKFDTMVGENNSLKEKLFN
jgi:hypothetical protein